MPYMKHNGRPIYISAFPMKGQWWKGQPDLQKVIRHPRYFLLFTMGRWRIKCDLIDDDLCLAKTKSADNTAIVPNEFFDLWLVCLKKTPQPDSEKCFALQTEPATPFTNWGPPQHAPFPLLSQGYRLMTEQTTRNPVHEKKTLAQKMYCVNQTAYISACFTSVNGNRTVSLWALDCWKFWKTGQIPCSRNPCCLPGYFVNKRYRWKKFMFPETNTPWACWFRLRPHERAAFRHFVAVNCCQYRGRTARERSNTRLQRMLLEFRPEIPYKLDEYKLDEDALLRKGIRSKYKYEARVIKKRQIKARQRRKARAVQRRSMMNKYVIRPKFLKGSKVRYFKSLGNTKEHRRREHMNLLQRELEDWNYYQKKDEAAKNIIKSGRAQFLEEKSRKEKLNEIIANFKACGRDPNPRNKLDQKYIKEIMHPKRKNRGKLTYTIMQSGYRGVYWLDGEMKLKQQHKAGYYKKITDPRHLNAWRAQWYEGGKPKSKEVWIRHYVGGRKTYREAVEAALKVAVRIRQKMSFKAGVKIKKTSVPAEFKGMYWIDKRKKKNGTWEWERWFNQRHLFKYGGYKCKRWSVWPRRYKSTKYHKFRDFGEQVAYARLQGILRHRRLREKAKRRAKRRRGPRWFLQDYKKVLVKKKVTKGKYRDYF